ncbi:MAG: gluconolactonase [Acidimicrobiales bacterium]|nr:gluconolactonase [Acidimicrobiales bacterium]
MEFTKVVDGVDFGEGPRWHDGLFWYSDFYQHAIYTVDDDGNRAKVIDMGERQPSGLGWLPNSDLLIVSMLDQQLVRWDGSTLHDYADLSAFATGKCNDMVVSATGHAYVGNFGFDLEGGGEPASTRLIHVTPEGDVAPVDGELLFPNGAVITPDGSTLIVGETFGGSYKAFTIGADGSLSDMRTFADVPGMAPDGCTLDAEGGIWFSDAMTPRVVRVIEGGEITHEAPTPQSTFACALGGDDGRTLYVLTAPGSHPDEVAGVGGGAVWTARVDTPGAGLP